jgi:hypothetical protein
MVSLSSLSYLGQLSANMPLFHSDFKELINLGADMLLVAVKSIECGEIGAELYLIYSGCVVLS